MSAEYETYSLGDWKLKNGGTITDAHIAYKTFGDSSNPAIIYPRHVLSIHSKSAKHWIAPAQVVVHVERGTNNREVGTPASFLITNGSSERTKLLIREYNDMSNVA